MIHFQILTTGAILDLPVGLELTYNLRHPAFDPESIDRVWTLPFRVPDSPRNREALGFVQRIDHVSTRRKLPAILFVDGVPLETGVLTSKGTANDSIELVFQNESLDLAQRLKELRLRDLNIPVRTGNNSYCSSIEFSCIRSGFIGPIPYIVTSINGNVFFTRDDDPEGLVTAVNEKYPGFIEFVSADDQNVIYRFGCTNDSRGYIVDSFPDQEPPEGGQWCPLSPFLLSTFPELQEIEEGFKDFIENNNQFKFPSIYMPNLSANEDEVYSGYVNLWQNDEDGYLTDNYEATFENGNLRSGWIAPLLPLPHVNVILEAIAKELGLDGTSGTISEDVEMQNLLLWHNTPLLQTVIIDIARQVYLRDYPGLFYPEEFNLADHTPDLTGMELISGLANTFALALDVKNNKIRFRSIKNLLDVEPRDISAKLSRAYKFKTDPKDGFFLTWPREDEGLKIDGQLEDVTVGKKSVEYIAPFFSLYEQDQKVRFFYHGNQEQFDSRVLRLPISEEEGTIVPENRSNEPGSNLLFWRGFQQEPLSTSLYPFASYNNRNPRGNTVGQYSLDWAGPAGRFEQWFKELIALEQHGRTDQRLMYMDVNDLLEIRNWSRGRVSYYTEEGTAVGIIESVRVRLRNVSPAVRVAELTLRLEP